MNERIRELEDEACLFARRQTTDLDEWEFIFRKKFAELIVRECARAVDKVYEDAEPDHGCYDWATWAEGADVLKHFGVD
jgi:hypothetical protein